MDRSRGRLRWLVALAVCFAGLLSAAVAVTASGRMQPPPTITRAAAIADAREQVATPADFETVKAELEPSSVHYSFTTADGSGRFGGDGVRECLTIAPIPIPLACRPYPVWVVELRSQSCDAVVAINGYSGRFAGAGTDSADCRLAPQAGGVVWFVPFWQ